MLAKLSLVMLLAAVAGCGSSASTDEAPKQAPRPTVFDPMTSTIGRAQGVQQTVDEQAA